jgi:predicted methyltransferase
MKKWIVPCLALLLAACGSSQHGAQAQASTAVASAPAAAASQAIAGDQPDEIVPPTTAGQMTAQRIGDVLKGAWRPDADKARDTYRHPAKTLGFFDIRPDMTVIEIVPGGGWYARILAPLLRQNGQYIAAVFSPISGKYNAKQYQSLKKLFASAPKVFDKASIIQVDPKTPNLGAPDSADMVLTFRNVHNWVQAGTQQAMFKAFYRVLKPGGVLGVVDHRAAPDTTLDAAKGSGYLPQNYVIKLATDAGFKVSASSEINANPKDTKDYPKGVWTLPPTLTLGDKDKAKYEAIGESDRMTLRFVKPGDGAR